MFFASEATVPFTSVREVMREYPDWKLQINMGNTIYFFPKALDGDKDYKEFYDRVISLEGMSQFSFLYC